MNHEKRSLEFYVLAIFFTIFVLFLYGPLSAIVILSFQGPDGGLTFPLNGVSLPLLMIMGLTMLSIMLTTPRPQMSMKMAQPVWPWW